MDLTQPDLGTQLVLAPPVLPVTATAEEKFRANLVRRAHPLYSLVTLKLLQEIMNGRLFTTVRPRPFNPLAQRPPVASSPSRWRGLHNRAETEEASCIVSCPR